MEKRIGAVIILLESGSDVRPVNSIISNHADLIIGRQGIPLRDRGINVISLVLEGTPDDIGSLTGRLGRLEGVKVRSVLTS